MEINKFSVFKQNTRKAVTNFLKTLHGSIYKKFSTCYI